MKCVFAVNFVTVPASNLYWLC